MMGLRAPTDSVRIIVGHSAMPHLPLRVAALVVSACLHTRAFAEQPLPLKLEPRLSEAAAQLVEGRPVYGRGDRLSGRTEREVTLQGDAEVRRAGTVVQVKNAAGQLPCSTGRSFLKIREPRIGIDMHRQFIRNYLILFIIFRFQFSANLTRFVGAY